MQSASIENLEIPLAQGDLERLHVEPIAREHAGMVAPLHVGRGTPAARLRRVNHVVMHQRRGVNHFHHRSKLNRSRTPAARELCGK
jgi:hypothetical protein